MSRQLSLVAAVALSLAGAACSDQEFTVNLDQPLRIVALEPAGESAGVRIDAVVRATFSEEVKADSVTAETFYLEAVDAEGAGTRIEADVAYDPVRLLATLTPRAPLAWSARHRVVATTGIARVRSPSARLPMEVRSLFTTEHPPAFRVVGMEPAPGTRAAAIDTGVRVTFSEELDPATVTEASFLVEDAVGGAAIAGTRTVEGAELRFAPAAPLGYSRTVRVVLGEALASLRATADGGHLEHDLAVTFHTEDPPELRVASLEPGAGTDDFVREGVFSVLFSEPLDPASATTETVRFEDVTDPLQPVPLAPEGAYLAFSEENARITFDPQGLLGFTRTVRVTLAGARDGEGPALRSARATAAGGWLVAPVVFTVKTIDPPELRIVQALLGPGTAGAPIDTEVSITFSEAIVDFTADPASSALVENLADPGAPFAVDGAWSLSADGATVTFTPLAPLAYDTPYRVTLTERVRSERATDEGGFVVGPIEWTFRTEPPPPLTLVAHVPSADALGVNRLTDAGTPQPLHLLFSEEVDPTTVADHLRLADHAGAPVPGNATANGATVTFEPALPLAYSARYVVTVDPALASVRGGRLGREVAFAFDTLDPPPLRLTATVPSGGAEGVARTQPIVLTFSEGVDQDAVRAPGAVEVYDVTTGAAVPGTLAFADLPDAPTRLDLAGDDVTVTFTPTPPDAAWPDVRWPYSRRFGVRLAATIGSDRATDGAANPTGHRGGWLDAGATFEFRVVDPPPLLVGDRVPGAGAQAVARTQPLELTFSEGVAQASVIPFDGTNDAAATLRIVDPDTGLPLAGALSFVPAADGAVDAEGRGADTRLVFTPEGGAWPWSQDVEVRLGTAIRSDRGLTYEGVDHGSLADPTLVWRFHVEDPPPLVVVATAPGPSQTDVEPDTTVAVTFSEALRPSSVTPATFVVEDVTGGAAVAVPGALALEGGDAAVVFTPAAPLALGARIQVTLTTGLCSAIATSRSGCLPQEVRYHFDVMPVPHLQIVATEPADGAQLVPLATPVRLVFNLDVVEHRIDPATNPGVIRIEDLTDPAAPVSVSIALTSYDAATHTAVYDVAAPDGPDAGDLAIRTPYRVTVRGGFDGPLTAQAGELIDDHVFDFVTGTNRLVLATTPDADAVGVDVGAPICVVLDSAVVESSVAPTSFSLTFVDEFGRTVAVPAAAYDFDRVDPVTLALLDEAPPVDTANQVCFLPDAAAFGCFTDGRTLLYHQPYTVTLTAAILTAAGPLEGGWTWSFTTGAPPLVARAFAGNDVVTVEPLAGADEVPVNAAFRVEFTAAMDPASLGAIELRDVAGGGAVPSTVTLSADGRTATLVPDAALAFLGARPQGYELFVRGGLTGPTDLAGNYLEADVGWRFRTSPATSLVLAVPQGGSVAVNSIVVAELSRAVHPPSLTPATLYLTAGAVNLPGLTSPRQDYRAIALIPAADLLGGTVHAIHVTTGLRDFRGNPMPAASPLPPGGRAGDAFVATFDTSNGNDPNNPSLSSSVPGNGGVLAAGAGPIVMNFSEPMNLASFVDGPDAAIAAVHLVDDLGARITTTFRALSPTSIQIWPDRFLRSGRTYTVTLDRDVSDAARNHLSATAFSFTVEAVRPTVTSVTPTNGAAGVAGETTVTARFSERMDPASLHAGSFTLACAGTPIAGTVAVAADGRSATLDPAAGLPAGSVCTVDVIGATDAAGNAVQPFAAAFTVVSGPMTVTLSPADGAVDVPADAPFVATFSRAVDPASLVPSTTTAIGTLGIRTGVGAIEVFGCPAVDPADPRRVEFRCVDPLLPATAYELFVGAGVTDHAGNPAVATTATFTTAP